MPHTIFVPAHAETAIKALAPRYYDLVQHKGEDHSDTQQFRSDMTNAVLRLLQLGPHKRRSVNRWIQGVLEDRYRTSTAPGHPYTSPSEDDDPHAILAAIVDSQEQRWVDLLRQQYESGEDVYAVISGDWHYPDTDYVAMDLIGGSRTPDYGVRSGQRCAV